MNEITFGRRVTFADKFSSNYAHVSLSLFYFMLQNQLQIAFNYQLSEFILVEKLFALVTGYLKFEAIDEAEN